MTVVFCDLVGSTDLGGRLDPEAFRHIQLRYFSACEQALQRHGGTVEKFIGDAVLCVFGTPTVREDDAIRACRAALDLVASVQLLNGELEAEWGVRLSVRTGVNTGLVAAGDPSRGQVLVTGDTVNVAARLEQAAGAGEILIGSATRELLGDDGVCAPLPPLSLKGKGEPVPAWRLIAVDTPSQAATAAASTRPLVGRENDLRRLEDWLTTSRAAGGICLLVGAPGVGKSRLLAEVVTRTSRRVLWGKCPPYGEGITYWPLAEWLDALGEHTAERIVGPDDAERLRFAVERSNQPATAEEIGEAARRLVVGLAGSGGLLVVAEDVHWAEPSMLDLLDSLAGADVAVITTARPEILEARPSLAATSADLRLSLRPLEPVEAAELLRMVSPDSSEIERERMLGAAEGNPLMIGQLALHVAEGGDPSKLPLGLEAVLQARVESLSIEERAVAERGAVMGREFWDSVVASLEPKAPSPATAIALLTARDFVVGGRADGAPDVTSPTLSRVFSTIGRPYSFTHALLRDSVYQATPKLRRAELHERLATLLEQQRAADELTAFHLERAARLRAELRPEESRQLATRAAGHLERAGERALARHDGAAARALLTRAATLLDDGSSARERIEASLAAAPPAQGVAELVPGDIVGGYRVRAVAGRGGMGVVYRADDLALGRQVALKVIAPQLAGDPRFRERFARETRIAAGLEHPHVVPVYGAGEEAGQLFIAMRFVDGTDLQGLLREGALAPERAVGIVAQVAQALDAAHARGLVHRDVKPSNVLVANLGATEQAYLTDFGLTRDAAAGDGLTAAGEWVGTLAYVAPEQIRGEPVDARADIYALGAVLYQSLTGQVPFPVESELEALAAHLDEPPPRPSEGGAPRALDAVVERAMSKDPSRRFRSAGDLGRAAVAAVEGRGGRLSERSVATGAAAPIDTGRRRQHRSNRRTLVIGAAVGAVVAAVFVAMGFAAGAFDRGSPTRTSASSQASADAPIRLQQGTDRLTLLDGVVWVLQIDTGRLARVDPKTRAVGYFPAPVDLGGGAFPAIAAGKGSIWLAHANATVGGIDRIDPKSVQAIERIRLPSAAAIAVGKGNVWATSVPSNTASTGGQAGTLARIDPKTNTLAGRALPIARKPVDVAEASGAVWIADEADDTLVRFDPRTGTVVARIQVGAGPARVAIAVGTVWVANLGDRTLTRVDPRTNRVVGAPLSLGKEIQDIAIAYGTLWVASADATVTPLDPHTGKTVGASVPVGRAPLALSSDGGELWVASAGDRTVQRLRENG